MNKFILIIGVVCAILIPGVLSAETNRIEAITKPSADVEISFVRNGKIKKVAVEEGAMVKKGQILARQENDIENIQLQMLTAQAEDTTKIRLAEVEAEQKKEDRVKFESARTEGALTDWELDHARLDEETANLKLKQARFEHEQDIRKKTESEEVLNQLDLTSPINGIVEEVKIEVGESVQELVPAIRVVQIDPLYIDAPVAYLQCKGLKPKQKVDVYFPEAEGKGPTIIRGQIKNISSVADAASNTIRVRIEVPNKLKRPAGERVEVSLGAS